ncbi:MAG: signal peptidase I [Verrucomicrobiaceae bacterium]|nr:signal peptidase I [Verrucomicrobiaceae bacterium]
MLFLTPRYMKQAKLLHKGVSRFINYKRDILPEAKLSEIVSLRSSLEDAMRAKDKARLDALSKQINDVCEAALPATPRSEIADNIEVFFVAIVVAFGIRSYILQPFKIPTGSMQPTLYGIVANPTAEDATPGYLQQAKDFVTGRSYIHVVSDHTGSISRREPLTEHGVLGFFTHCKLHFEDGHSIRIWAPMAQLINSHFNLGLFEHVGAYPQEDRSKVTPDMVSQRYVGALAGRLVTKGQVLASGTLDTGDHVLVNKFAYHFRTPTRGEVFVFTTNNIRSQFMNVPAEQGSQHYIKRLVGVPGDTLEVKPPALWINGKPAEEMGMKRVASLEGLYNKGYGAMFHLEEGRKVTLKDEEYWAMGDNSFNSSDSRYWGHVPERNLVGPALFCYFPFGRNWGLIR